jgi:hypothetical protein
VFDETKRDEMPTQLSANGFRRIFAGRSVTGCWLQHQGEKPETGHNLPEIGRLSDFQSGAVTHALAG